MKLSAKQQETQRRPLIPNSYSSPVKQQSQKQSLTNGSLNPKSCHQINSSPKNPGRYPILIEVGSEKDLSEIPIASRNKTNSDITTSATIIQNLYLDTSNEFEDVNVSYIGRRKYIHGLVFENIQAIKCDSVQPDIDDTVVYEVPIGSSGKPNP